MDRNQPQNVNQKLRSRKVDSEEKLVEYTRMMLGHPMIQVDVSDDQILLNIDEAIRKFSDFAYGGEQRVSLVIDGDENTQDYRLDPRVQSILSVSFGNSLGSGMWGNGGSVNLGPGWGTIGVGYIPHITMQGEISSLEGMSNTSHISGVAGGIASGTSMDNISNAYVNISQRDTLQSMFAKGVNFEYNSNTKILRVFEKISGPFLIEAAVEYQPNPEYDDIYAHPWIKDYVVAITRRLWSTVTGKYSQSLVGGAEINFDKMQTEAEQMIEKLDEDLLNKYSEALGIFSG